MTASHIVIKLACIATIAIAVISILLGLAACGIGGLGFAAMSSDASMATASNEVATILIISTAGFAILGGIIDLVVAILGLRGLKNVRKINLFNAFVVIGFIFALMDLVSSAGFGGSGDPTVIASNAVELALMVVLLVCIHNVKKHAEEEEPDPDKPPLSW